MARLGRPGRGPNPTLALVESEADGASSEPSRGGVYCAVNLQSPGVSVNQTLSRHPLIDWILEALDLPVNSWDSHQIAFLDSVLDTQEGPRVLGSLVVTTLRLRQSAFKSEQMGHFSTILPAIEAFWSNPSPQTFQDLRIARW